MRLALSFAALLLVTAQAQAFDLGAALKSATDVANAVSGNQNNPNAQSNQNRQYEQDRQYEEYRAQQAAQAEAYQREADCRAKLAENQDKVALLQIAGSLSGDQATQAQLEDPQALCARMAAQQANTTGNSKQNDAINIGSQLLNSFGK